MQIRGDLCHQLLKGCNNTFSFNDKAGRKTVRLSEYKFSSNGAYLNGFALVYVKR